MNWLDTGTAAAGDLHVGEEWPGASAGTIALPGQ